MDFSFQYRALFRKLRLGLREPDPKRIGIAVGIVMIPVTIIGKHRRGKMHQSVSQEELDSFWRGVGLVVYGLTATTVYFGIRRFHRKWRWFSRPRG